MAPDQAPEIAVLVTCHNRRETTLACLEGLFGQEGLGTRFLLRVFLVDAGSTDGTAEAVESRFEGVTVVRANSDVFWGHGTRRASMEAARAAPAAGFELWLNDDVVLTSAAVDRLLDTLSDCSEPCIVVGQLIDTNGHASYGGFGLTKRPLGLHHLGVLETAAPCQTFNGNVVLIPRMVTKAIGTVDSAFPHGMGDIDFGLRALRAGYTAVQAAGSVGCCDTHGTGKPPPPRFMDRLREVAHVKQLPPRPWWVLCRRHAGFWSPLLFLKPYVESLYFNRGE